MKRRKTKEEKLEMPARQFGLGRKSRAFKTGCGRTKILKTIRSLDPSSKWYKQFVREFKDCFGMKGLKYAK